MFEPPVREATALTSEKSREMALLVGQFSTKKRAAFRRPWHRIA